MKQNQMTPLLIICIVFISLTTLFLPVSLCLFTEWSEWANVEFENVEISVDVITDLAILLLMTILHIVFYQLAIRRGLKNVIKARLTACIGTAICALLILTIPIHSMFDLAADRLSNADYQTMITALVLLSVSYIVGIIYAIRHYPH